MSNAIPTSNTEPRSASPAVTAVEGAAPPLQGSGTAMSSSSPSNEALQDQKPAPGKASASSNASSRDLDSTQAASSSPDVSSLDPQEYRRIERRLLWKIDLQVTLLCTVLYLLSFLDRTNIGQAKLLGLTTQLSLSSHDYRVALTVLYPAYIVFEIPSNLVLKKLGAARLIPGLVMAWGTVSTLQGIVSTRTGLYINRVFLGLAEAGILPGIVLYLTFFYKKDELQLRQALYFSGAALAGAFGALLAAAITNIDAGGLQPWSWLFIIEGMFTVIFGALCLWILPNGVRKLKGLTPMEMQVALHRIGKGSGQSYETTAVVPSHDGAEASGEKGHPSAVAQKGNPELEAAIHRFRFSEVLHAWTDPFVILLAVINFCVATGIYSLAFFAPTIVKTLDVSGNGTTLSIAESLLLVTPPFAAAFVMSILLGIFSDRTGWRGGSALFAFALAIVGFGMSYGSGKPGVQYAATIIQAMGSYSLPSVTLTWISTNCWSHYVRATATATMIVFTNSGGILSTWLFPDADAPRFFHGYRVNLALNILGFVLTLVLEGYIWWERKQKAEGKKGRKEVEETKRQWPGASDEQVREWLGDRHPDFKREY